MFDKLFGKKNKPPSEAELDRWHAEKMARLERALGKADDRILHVIVADPQYGPFNTAFFRHHIPGTGLTTIQLARLEGGGLQNAAYKMYEMAIFSRDQIGAGEDLSDVAGNSPGGMLRVALNEIAAYALRTALEPGATLEFPADYDDYVGGRCFIVDAYEADAFDKTFGLMLVIEIHRDEMDFARRMGGPNLIAKLQAANIYPYSALNRPSVIGGAPH